MADVSLQSWREVLCRWRRREQAWLVLPRAAHRSQESRTLSYQDLSEYALRASHALRAAGGAGTSVVVIADNSAECCLCMFGALIAGLPLVPVPPCTLGRPHVAWKHELDALLRELSPALLLGSEADLRGFGDQGEVEAVSFGALLARGLPIEGREEVDPSSVAILQRTSGTTGQPRSVELTHANVLHNIVCIGRAISASENDVGASWLPLFHDMGLIGSLLFSCYWGMPLVLMAPRAFVARPEAWLWAISRFKATCSAAPNSAYEICASKVDASRLAGIDLSSWRAAFNGAELVHPPTVQRFCERFREHGFRPEAMYPVYGLAEHTVAAALPRHSSGVGLDWVDAAELESSGRAVAVSRESPGARAIAAVGQPLPGHELRVVRVEEGVCAGERVVGEIELRGPSRMRGYRGERDCFAPDGWLRTGDLGYVARGSLHVVGRRKHMIKRGGKLIDAARIESAARVVSGLRNAVVAAFGVPDDRTGTERLVVLAEASRLQEREQQSVRREIVRAIMEAVCIAPDVIEFVQPGGIPRTTSGKVRHAAARQRYMGAAE